MDVSELDANGDHVLMLAIVRDFYEAAKISEDKGDEVEKKKPDVLKSEDWVEWEKSIIHYLDGMRNRKGVPLSYVIRGNQPQNVQLSSDEQMIFAAALTGPQFNNDSKEVYNLIKELVQNTDGDSWLPPRCNCKRAAMQSLRNHYDGPDQAKARIDVARASIEKLFVLACNWPERRKKDLQDLAFYITQRSLDGIQVNIGEVDANGDHMLTLAIVRGFYKAAKEVLFPLLEWHEE